MANENPINNQAVQAERRTLVHRDFNNYLDTQVFRPVFLHDFLDAYHALERLTSMRRGTYNIEQILQETNAVALNERLPPLTHLAGIATLQGVMTSPQAQEYAQGILEIQNNFATLADRLRAIDPNMFGARKDTNRDVQLMIAALANMSPTEAKAPEENPNARMNLDVISELLRTKDLQLFFHGINIVSISTDEEYIEGNPIFPDSTIILSRGRLADLKMMELAVVHGIPEKDKRKGQVDFRKSLPNALVGIEHQRRYSFTATGAEKRTSKITPVFLPILDRPHTNPKALFDKGQYWDREVIESHLINSLTFYGAKQMLRTIRKARIRAGSNPDEQVVLSREVLESFARRTLENKFKKKITHPQIRNGEASVLDKAEEEYNQGMYTQPWERIDIEESLIYSFMCLGAEYVENIDQNSRNMYRVRSEEEIEDLTVQQTVRDIPFPKLVDLADIFKNRAGAQATLTEEQRDYINNPTVQGIIQGIIDAQQNKEANLETPERTHHLQEYLRGILQVRYITIRRKSIEGLTDEEKGKQGEW